MSNSKLGRITDDFLWNDMNYQLSLMRATFNASLDGILVVDHESKKVRDYNNRFLELWNIPKSLADEKNDEKLIQFVLDQLKEPKKFLDLVQDLYANPDRKSTDTLEFKNGRFFDRYSEPLIIDSQICGRIWFFRDVTEKTLLYEAVRDQRERLAQSQTFLETILGALPSLVSYVSTDFKYVYLNSTYERWWGISKDNFIGRPIESLLNEKAYPIVKQALELAMRGQSMSYESEINYWKVGWKTVQVNYIPHILENGEVKGVFVIVHDISALKQTERELIAKERFLNMIVENIPTALFLKDAANDFKITLWNKAAEDIFGVPREKILGKGFNELLPQAQSTQSFEADQRVVRDSVTVEIHEEKVQTLDGRTIYLHTVKLPIKTGEAVSPSHVLCVCDDITSQREAHRALLQSAKMSSLGEMASGIAHEINNPLAIIHGVASLMRERLEKGNSDPRTLIDHLARIEKTTQRIAKIVKGLRAFSRNSEADPMQMVKVSQIVEDTLELCKERFRIHGVEVKVDIDTSVSVECRGTQISQVLMNLLSNSYDAVEGLTEKWVELKAEVQGAFLKMTVTDSGHGISSAIHEKIMQPFFTTKEVGSGTGLGLSISKGIVEEHHGELYYDAQSRNTRFVLILPLKQGGAIGSA